MSGKVVQPLADYDTLLAYVKTLGDGKPLV